MQHKAVIYLKIKSVDKNSLEGNEEFLSKSLLLLRLYWHSKDFPRYPHANFCGAHWNWLK